MTFTVSASGSAPLSYQWLRNGANVTNGGNVIGATSSTLTLTNVQIGNAGSYTVAVSNPGGM